MYHYPYCHIINTILVTIIVIDVILLLLLLECSCRLEQMVIFVSNVTHTAWPYSKGSKSLFGVPSCLIMHFRLHINAQPHCGRQRLQASL